MMAMNEAKAGRECPRKEKDMIAMNRMSYLDKLSTSAAHLDEREMGVGFVYSSIDKHKRRNCVFELGVQ